MPICRKCNDNFPNSITVEEKRIYLHRRSYCLECSPMGQRLRSGPWPKDADPFSRNPNTYPSGRRRPMPRVCRCPICQKDFIKLHRNLTCNACRRTK